MTQNSLFNWKPHQKNPQEICMNILIFLKVHYNLENTKPDQHLRLSDICNNMGQNMENTQPRETQPKDDASCKCPDGKKRPHTNGDPFGWVNLLKVVKSSLAEGSLSPLNWERQCCAPFLGDPPCSVDALVVDITHSMSLLPVQQKGSQTNLHLKERILDLGDLDHCARYSPEYSLSVCCSTFRWNLPNEKWNERPDSSLENDFPKKFSVLAKFRFTSCLVLVVSKMIKSTTKGRVPSVKVSGLFEVVQGVSLTEVVWCQMWCVFSQTSGFVVWIHSCCKPEVCNQETARKCLKLCCQHRNDHKFLRTLLATWNGFEDRNGKRKQPNKPKVRSVIVQLLHWRIFVCYPTTQRMTLWDWLRCPLMELYAASICIKADSVFWFDWWTFYANIQHDRQSRIQPSWPLRDIFHAHTSETILGI